MEHKATAGDNGFVLFSDITCPWSHSAVHRWRAERARRELEDEVFLDLRCFPLELFNRRPTPKRILDAEIPVAGSLSPEAGWQMWAGAAFDYPVSSLLAMEAVHAARDQSAKAAEELDLALRRAFFEDSRNISLHHEIIVIARERRGVDEQAVEEALESGRARRRVFDDYRAAQKDEIKGSPHFFLEGGGNWHNPGVEMHWEGEGGKSFPVIDKDDPGAFAEMFDRYEDLR